MKNIKIIVPILILATLSLLAFGPLNVFKQEQFSCANVTEISQIECEALVALYPEIRRPYGWLETTTPCNWSSIVCEEGHVTELNLSFNNLSSLPEEISNLTNLTELTFDENELRSLPPEIGNLTNLTECQISDSQLNSLPCADDNLGSFITGFFDSLWGKATE